MNVLPRLVDREAEADLLSAILEALQSPRSLAGSRALSVLRLKRSEDLFACSDTRALFEEWQEAVQVGRGRRPEEALRSRGLADDVSPCGDCLAHLSDTLRRLQEVARRRHEELNRSYDWDAVLR